MPEKARKMSEIMKEMSETLLRNPGGVRSSEAAHVALLFANVAWNESVSLDHPRDGYRNVWETMVADNQSTHCRFQNANKREPQSFLNVRWHCRMKTLGILRPK